MRYKVLARRDSPKNPGEIIVLGQVKRSGEFIVGRTPESKIKKDHGSTDHVSCPAHFRDFTSAKSEFDRIKCL